MKKNIQPIILVILVSTLISSVNAQNKEIITNKRISSSMAGEGDPWEVLTDDL
jgi:hypothetical protein